MDISDKLAFGSYEDARRMVGVATEPRTAGTVVSAARIQLFAAMVCDGNPSYWDKAAVGADIPAAGEGVWSRHAFVRTGRRRTGRVTSADTLMDGALQLAARLAAQPARALQTTKRAFSKHLAQAAIAIVDYGLAAETLEIGADEHIDKVREFLGTDKYDAIVVPDDAPDG